MEPDFLNKLEKSLYISLVHFYHLAGQLRTQKFHDEHACCFYLDCEAGPGARLVHATVDFSVSEVFRSIDVHPIVESFFDLGEKYINYDGHTRPLLSVQVTELLDGVFVGFTMNHCIADGTSLWHFISTLSEIFAQINDSDKNEDKEKSWTRDCHKVSISRIPIFETLFPRSGPITSFKVPYLEPNEFVTRYDPGPLRALCAFMWQSITRARNLQPDDKVECTVMMNARSRLDPPLPSEYFRCLLSATHGVSNKAGDLMNNSLGQAALLVNQRIKMQDEKYFLKVVKHVEEHPCVVQHGPGSSTYNPNKMTIGGSTRFDMYGPDFGLGKPVAVLAGYANRDDGKLTANPGREGDGSVDLEVCLKPETMNALELDDEFMSFVSLI